jgi:hypothetical protein
MPNDLMLRCEQRRQFMVSGEAQWRWTEVAVPDAVGAAPGSIRCMHCHGAVRIHKQQVEHGPQDHVEHRTRQDSEFCKGGTDFGGEHRLSARPIH